MERAHRGVQPPHGSAGVVLSQAPALRCTGCGWVSPADAPYPFRCRNADAGDDCDHLLVPAPPAASVTGQPASARLAWVSDPDASQPFVRFRGRLWAYAFARARGVGDTEFVDRVARLDAAVALVDGRGLRVTPLVAPAALNARCAPPAGVVWVKDETTQPGGSHKARHLFGLSLTLGLLERTGLASRAESDRRGLAIASCGNAALAAAILARAEQRPLRVFIPVDADPVVVAQLRALAAEVIVCPRRPGEHGDPCMLAFRAAVRSGAIPFCCQGSENGLTLEGGRTLGFEIAEALAREGRPLDRIFVQVGGGALASSCWQALREGVALGALPRLPRLHAVQTDSGWPLRRAWEQVQARLGEGWSPAATLAHAATHRSQYMWPWESAPASIAHGILDDETYDWLAVVAGMLEAGGFPVTVSEERLGEAQVLARATTPIRADATGTAGLAGLLESERRGELQTAEAVAVLFTGAERAPNP